jgi:ABC-2 type transport system ATP-binding protein
MSWHSTRGSRTCRATSACGQAIDLLGNLRGGLDEQRRADLIERFELDPTKRGRQYSKGNRQKVAIVAALASDVELLILDEPTSGLDPLMEAVFQEEILKEKQNGRSILLSSHILSEAEALADRVSIIRDGRVVETGTLDQMRHRARSTIHAVLADPPATLDDLVFIEDATLDGHRFSGSVDVDRMNEAMAVLSRFGISGLTVAPPSLEDLFLRHYGDDSPEEGQR